MRRLRTHQRVMLDIDGDGDDQVIECTLVERVVSAALLAPERAPARSVAAQLQSAALGYLVFEHHGAMVGLRGVAKVTPKTAPLIAFVVVDGVHLPERRTGERVEVEVRATLTGMDGVPSPALETRTVNISLGGALIRRPKPGWEADRMAVELYFGTDPEPIRAEAHQVRSSAENIAVRFEQLDAGDRTRLIERLAGHRRIAQVRQGPATPARPAV